MTAQGWGTELSDGTDGPEGSPQVNLRSCESDDTLVFPCPRPQMASGPGHSLVVVPGVG